MKSDIQIASEIKLKPISEIAESIGINKEEFHQYGHVKGKVDPNILKRLKDKPNGKLVIITAINPTPLGEGKTVTTIGTSLAIAKRGKKVFTCLRQPSMGPVFGIKGGAAGGGYSQVIPIEDININLTGDIHAITAAHNLGSAALDARLFHEEKMGYEKFEKRTGIKALKIDKDQIFWKRIVDINDRALRGIQVGLPSPGEEKNNNGIPRYTNFDIAVASELMAILALSDNLQDMRKRIGRAVMAMNIDGEPITTDDLGVAGSMTVIMKETIMPTLMQTTEYTPCFIHSGPFANIAHGNSSIIADKIALKLSDYVVTEAGFGSDMGFEKFCNIKTRCSKIKPNAAVIVCSVRALKTHSGNFKITPGKPLDVKLTTEDIESISAGIDNLAAHIENVKQYNVPAIVAINRFPTDTDNEIKFIKEKAIEFGAYGVAESNVHTLGGNGGLELADIIIKACDDEQKLDFKLLYEDNMSLFDKIKTICNKVYGTNEIEYSDLARKQLTEYDKKYRNFPICMAKTQYSLSHDPDLKCRPKNFVFPIREARLSAGAEFIYILTGAITTMPGFGSNPGYPNIDIDENDNVIGLS